MSDNSPLSLDDGIELRSPVLIAAFKGWNDAGDSASFAAEHLARVWGAKKFGSIDPEEFYDFQAVRPQVSLSGAGARQVHWPANEFHAVHFPGAPHDAIILIGVEPSHRWRTFSQLVLGVAERFEVSMMITLGALLADVPHSREVPVTGTANKPELVDRLDLNLSRYEGPTGIIGVLHDAFGSAGLDSASFWAAVPHYLAVNPNPKAALALVDRAVSLVGAPADVSDLHRAALSYEDTVTEIVASDEDVQTYVKLLEERADEREHEEQIEDLPSGDAIAEELERFLRDRDL